MPHFSASFPIGHIEVAPNFLPDTVVNAGLQGFAEWQAVITSCSLVYSSMTFFKTLASSARCNPSAPGRCAAILLCGFWCRSNDNLHSSVSTQLRGRGQRTVNVNSKVLVQAPRSHRNALPLVWWSCRCVVANSNLCLGCPFHSSSACRGNPPHGGNRVLKCFDYWDNKTKILRVKSVKDSTILVAWWTSNRFRHLFWLRQRLKHYQTTRGKIP